MIACLECLIENHQFCECPLPVDGALICCCPPETLHEVEHNKRGGPVKDPDEITDPKSTGRKRAAQLYPIEEGMICEWSRLKRAGGGVFPVIGCLGNKASDRHHGPDKNTLNNSSGNVHRICDHCLGIGMRILMADLTWKNAENISLGDRILAFSEEIKHGVTKYEYGEVTGVSIVQEPSYRITTSKGHELISSHAHLWVASSPGRHHPKWRRTEKLKLGYNLRFLVEPWEIDTSYQSGWLAGMLDGEGSLSGLHLGIGQKDDEVCDNLQGLLEYYVKGNIHHTYRTQGLPFWNFRVTNVPDVLRLLGQVRPIRLLQKIPNYLEGVSPLMVKNNRTAITSIEYIGVQDVVSIQTTTKTLITEGYLSHNCHGRWHTLNDPEYPKERPAGDTPFIPSSGKIIPHDSETLASEKEIVENELWWYSKKKDKGKGNAKKAELAGGKSQETLRDNS